MRENCSKFDVQGFTKKTVTIQSYNARLQMANNITLNGNYLFWGEPFMFS